MMSDRIPIMAELMKAMQKNLLRDVAVRTK